MKKLGFFLAVLALFFSFTSRGVGVSAGHAVLVDAATGEVLYEKSAYAEAPIASTTKIMTALVALETVDTDTRIRITRRHYAEGSSMYLKAGEIRSVEELLYGLLLMSGNDAALALADAAAGSTESFVRLMNQKAQKLGLSDTHFENPSGLDGPAHYSSASDMARLTAYALQNGTFLKIVSCKSASIAGRLMKNHNRLLWMCEGADGVKTGYTRSAGRCLVSSAVRKGRRLICVTLSAGDDWNDHTALYDFGFSLYEERQLAVTGQRACCLPVVSGTAYSVDLCCAADASAHLTDGQATRVRSHLEAPRFAYAPVSAGLAAGSLVFTLDGQEIARTPLVYAESVEKAPPKMTFRRRLLEFLNLW